MDSNKYYTIEHLIEAFNKAGLSVSRWWIYKQEAKGNLKLPRSTTNFKKALGTRKIGFVRLVTKDQIDKIVKAFLPGGSGYYNYKD